MKSSISRNGSAGALEPAPRTTWLGRLAGFVLHHRKLVVIGWVVLLVAGGTGAGQLSNRLSYDFGLPGQPGYETAQKIIHIYGNGGDQQPSIAVVTTPASTTVAAQRGGIAAAFADLRRADPTLRVVDYGDTGDARFVTSDGRATYALLFAPVGKGFSSSTAITRAPGLLTPHLPQGDTVRMTGYNELSNSSSSKGQSVLVETLLGGLGALIVLAIVFGSFVALLPLLVAVVSITTTLLVVLGLTYMTTISFVVEFLVALVGLGVAIDYSLLVVTRWREERAKGRDNESAVQVAMETAGRAVLFSGITVGIGLMALIVLPVPSLRSIGIGGILIPVVSVLVTLTLLPAVLGGFGPRMDWPRLRHEARASRPWTAWARGIVRYKWVAALGAVGVLVLFVSPVFGIRVGLTGASALSRTGPAHAAYEQLLAGGVPSGVLTPVEVLTSTSAAPAAAQKLAAVPDMTTVAAPTATDSNRDGTTVLIGIPASETVNSATLGPVTGVRTAMAGLAGVVGVAGVGAVQLDYSHAVFGNFPLMLSVIAILTYLLLARAFRSLLLPAKAVLLNLLSVSAIFGLVTWFWQDGHGSSAVFNIPATGAITFWVPLMIFAFLFGLSMDYEVFILSRMREEYDRTGSTPQAVVVGLGRTGRLVTSAALILFLAFASLASASFTDLKVFATALGAGILVDATIVRALLLPALVAILGKWNWWMPDWAARLLRAPAPVAAPAPPLEPPRELVDVVAPT